ncbi:unnamed protein product [Mycena citricolor]|uniref:Ricin B lectin domain-containing protein n=1 Tax=Mycena citricolor TaxID=2018698 RepID=A0AAD2Q2V6_9AGAR|nr:unnamed protein product [Mycena citricolor]
MLSHLVLGSLLARAAFGLIIESDSPAFTSSGTQGCIAASSNADGAPVVIQHCDTASPANQEWVYSTFTRQDAGPQPITVFGDKCLDVVDGAHKNGTKLQIWTCAAGNTNQQWISVRDFTMQWAGTNLCIDLTDASTTPGTQLQLWMCDTRNTNQKWTGLPDPRLVSNVLSSVISSTDDVAHCLAAESDADGAAVVIVGCLEVDFKSALPNGNITWTAPSLGFSGPITIFENKCLDVSGGSTADGTKLQIWTCGQGNPNQLFSNIGDQIQWKGTNQCIDLTGGNLEGLNQIQMWACATNGNPNQGWFVAPLGG